MARPSKATVDYFPHITKSGKTIFILENKFKNDGYAVWFKILELLGSTDGHFIDCRDEPTWQYLIAKSLVSEEVLIDIIETLVALDAIDKDLWEHRIIFSQNFVDNVRDAYKRRKIQIPSKESIIANLGLLEPGKCMQKPTASDQSTPENPQSKLNKTKVNKTIEDREENWNKIASAYTNLTGRLESPVDVQEMKEVLKLADTDQIIQLMQDIYKRFKPKYDGDKIKSFSYFRAAIEGELKGGGKVGADRGHSEKSDAAKRFYSKSLDDI